jgi:hypothetical protein
MFGLLMQEYQGGGTDASQGISDIQLSECNTRKLEDSAMGRFALLLGEPHKWYFRMLFSALA